MLEDIGLRADRSYRQFRAAKWCVDAFGRSHFTNTTQRAVRQLEESVELYQALAGDRDMAHKLVDYIFDRPAGDVRQELGGAGLTLIVLAEACGLSADECEVAELERVLAKPLSHFAARNRVKNDAGFNVEQPDG